MGSRKALFRQTGIMAAGMAVCTTGMVGVFALLGHWDTSVLLGAVAGGTLSVLNYCAMALCADLAADKAAAQDVKGGQALLQVSYIGRMIGLFLVWYLCVQSGLIDPVALVLPVLFTQPILTATEFFGKTGGQAP